MARAQQQLQDETGGAFVAVLGSAGLNGMHASVLYPGSGISGDPYRTSPRYSPVNQASFKVVSIDGTQYASA